MNQISPSCAKLILMKTDCFFLLQLFLMENVTTLHTDGIIERIWLGAILFQVMDQVVFSNDMCEACSTLF